jgi:hypothetical protein
LAGRVRVCAAFPDAELGQPLSQSVLRARKFGEQAALGGFS